MTIVYHPRRVEGFWPELGKAIAKDLIKAERECTGVVEVAAVVPTLLRAFGTHGEYEVREVIVLVKETRP